MQALGRGAVLDQCAKKLIDEAVSRKVRGLGKDDQADALGRAVRPFPRGRKRGTARVHWSTKWSRIPSLKPVLPTYGSVLKEEADEARDLAERLRAYHSKYVAGQVTLGLPIGGVFDPACPAEDFEARASFLEEIVGDFRDAGGAPPMLRAFKALARV